jgi:glycosyltransferase involved in cell wall biosynthesis
LGGLVWRLLEKRISLWYTHKSVDLKLRLATLITEYIFTASRMSFRLNSKKVNVTGHGIDTSLFMPNNLNKKNGVYTIVCVGRISKTKDQLNLIKAIEIVIKSGILVKLMIIGEPITDEDLKYLDTLKNYVSDQKLSNAVIFSGPVTSANMPTYYQNADMSVNLSKTGSLDKVVLESMSCGLVSLSSNEAFLDILGPYNMMLSDANPEEISKKIIYFAKTENTSDIRNKLREFVINGHSLNKLIPKILNVLK